MIVAHRGCWNEAVPENSLAAIRRCEAIGADIIEIDVGVTSDGTPVLMHDDTVDRTTNGSGAIADVAPSYSRYDPIAYEVVYSTGDFLREGVGTMRAMGGRIWVNTLEPRHAAGHTDALAIADPDAHWGQVIRDGANIIQTDRPALLLDYLRRQGLRSN